MLRLRWCYVVASNCPCLLVAIFCVVDVRLHFKPRQVDMFGISVSLRGSQSLVLSVNMSAMSWEQALRLQMTFTLDIIWSSLCALSSV